MKSSKAPTRRKEARQPDAGPPPMRRYTLFSMGVHVLVFSFLSLPIIHKQRPVPADPLYEVALIQWPEPNYEPPVPTVKKEPAKPREPKPKPPPPKEQMVPVDPVVKKSQPVEKKPPAPQKVPVKNPAETAEQAEEPVSLGTVDQKDFKHDYYLQLVRSRLARVWEPPSGGTGILLTRLHFVILRDGTIIEVEIVGSSNWSLYDRSAQRAVLDVKKLPPLPEAYSGDRLGLTVNFRSAGEDPS